MDESSNADVVTLIDLFLAALSGNDEVCTDSIVAYAKQTLPKEIMEQYGMFIPILVPIVIEKAKALVKTIKDRTPPADKAYDKGAIIAKYIEGLQESGMTVDQAISVYETVEYAKTSRLNAFRLPKDITVNLNNK